MDDYLRTFIGLHQLLKKIAIYVKFIVVLIDIDSFTISVEIILSITLRFMLMIKYYDNVYNIIIFGQFRKFSIQAEYTHKIKCSSTIKQRTIVDTNML